MEVETIEVEEKGVSKAKAGFVICAVLVVILAFSTALGYLDLQEQKNLNKNLQNQLTVWETTYQNYVSTHSHSNLEYDHYVNYHQYTTPEFYASLFSRLYENSKYHEAMFSLYYIEVEEQKFGNHNLNNELRNLEWIEQYEEDVFDCSEMSACLEWYLENMGWHVMIVCGDTPFESGRHSWLIVETSEGEYTPVESTNLDVVWETDTYYDNYWKYDRSFETILEAIYYHESSYDWWELGFCPLECS